MQLKNAVTKKAFVSLVVILLLCTGAVFAYHAAHGSHRNNTTLTAPNQYQNKVSAVSQGDGQTGESVASAKKASSTSSNSSKTSTKTSTAKTSGTTSTTDPTCSVKAKTNSNGKKVFYLSNNKSYKRVKADQCFPTADAAAAAGYQNASQK